MPKNPMFKNGLVDGVFHLAKDQMPNLVSDYVNTIETAPTREWCRCEWIIHPDDVDIDIYNCVNCHHPRALHTEIEGLGFRCRKVVVTAPNFEDEKECDCLGWVDPPKRRMRRGEQDPICAVHTKQGFVLGFFEYLFPMKEEDKKSTPNAVVDNEHGIKAHYG